MASNSSVNSQNKCSTEIDMKDIYHYGAQLVLYSNKSDAEIISEIKNKGVTDEQAKVIFYRLKEKQSEMERSGEPGIANMILGIIAIIGSVGATVYSLNSAEPGHKYFIFYGAGIFGIISLFRGLFQFLGAKNRTKQ